MATSREIAHQIPSWLSRFEDPWGIVWRTSNLVRRLSVRRTAKFAAALGTRQEFDRPLFILGAPRSGTTAVFRWLAAAPGFGSLPREGHDLWRAYHHPRYGGWQSDSVEGGALGIGERRFAGAFLRSYFHEGRFVEKTPENSFRVPYLLDLFPDARFLVVRRNPALTIQSLISGWRDPAGRFRSYFVPDRLRIPGYPHGHQWCFALIEGWRGLTEAPIPQIACEQWRAFADALSDARERYGAGRWMEIRLEDWLEQPEVVAEKVYDFAEITPDAALQCALREMTASPVYASAAQNMVDATELRDCVERLASRIRKTGYAVEFSAERWSVRPDGRELPC